MLCHCLFRESQSIQHSNPDENGMLDRVASSRDRSNWLCPVRYSDVDGGSQICAVCCSFSDVVIVCAAALFEGLSCFQVCLAYREVD
jgi:hypothetical protein